MNLLEWITEEFKEGVELFNDIKTITKNGATLTRDVSRLHKCSVGLISAQDAKDWYHICRLNCPVGTVIVPYTDDWESIYNDNLLLVKLELTKALLDERFNKSAKTLIDILERRSKDEWGKDPKQVKVEQNKETNNLTVTFDIV